MIANQMKLEDILTMACSDPLQRANFFDILLESDIYFLTDNKLTPTNTLNQEQRIDTSERTNIGIQQIDIEGETFIPFFSSLSSLSLTLTEERQYCVMPAVPFFKMLHSCPYRLYLNPNSACNKIFSSYETALLSLGKNPAHSQKITPSFGDSITLMIPDPYPSEIAEVFKNFFKKIKSIKKAYLIYIINHSTDTHPHILIVIDVKKDDFSIVSNKIGGLVLSKLNHLYPVDITRFLDEKDPISNYCLEEAKPFYKRGIFAEFNNR